MYKIVKVLEDGNATGVRQSSMQVLRGKGVQKTKPNMFTVGSSTNKRNFCPTSVILYIYTYSNIYIYKYMSIYLRTHAYIYISSNVHNYIHIMKLYIKQYIYIK